MDETFPVLSLKERDRRWSLTRNMMKSQGVDCLIVPGLKGREEMDGYLANESAEGFVVFPLEGNPVHLTWTATRATRRIEISERGEVPWIEDIRVGSVGPGLVGVLKERGMERARIGVVGLETRGPGEPEGVIPYKTWAHVVEALPHGVFKEISHVFGELMLVKSDEELSLMRRSAEIGEEACKLMLETAEQGVSERDLYVAITELIFRRGAAPPAPFLIVHSGLENLSWGPPSWIYRGGPSRILEKGDLVQAEIFPRYGGLESQQQMSVHIQPENRTVLECARVARRSYEAGLSALRPGATFQEVCDAMAVPLLEAGCWHLTPLIHSLSPLWYVSPTGVGMERVPGLEKHAAKGRAGKIPGANPVIRKGMVFELEPNACRERYRVNIGGTVVVTEDGAEELNFLPTEMRVKG